VKILTLENRHARWRCFLLCCFLAIFGFRAFLVERYGASIPQVDEWEAIGQKILLPWENGTLTLAALFQAHNGDHRIVATRLWEIFWYEVNGAWDPKLVMIAKGAIFAAAAVGFIHLLVGRLERRRFVAGALLAGLFAFPFSFHNLFWAFQSQFDFFLLALACGWLALRAERPIVALGIAAIAPFTLGAGPILAASYVPYALGAGWEKRWPWRKSIAVSVAAVAIFVAGASLRAPDAAPLGPVRDQAKAFAMLLGWPHSGLVTVIERLPETAHLIPQRVLNFPRPEASLVQGAAGWMREHPAVPLTIQLALALLVLAPTIALTVVVLRRRRIDGVAWGPLGLGGFAFAMMAATAVARSQEPGVVAVRFLDLVALTGLAALACSFILAARGRAWRKWMLVWALISAPSYLVTMAATAARIRQNEPQRWLENTRAFFPSRDPEVFQRLIAADPHWPLPFFNRDIDQLVQMLNDPALAPILPRSVVAPEEPPRPIARAASAMAEQGLWIVFAAVAAAGSLGWRRRGAGATVSALAPASAAKG
jgi:hypothetical protein